MTPQARRWWIFLFKLVIGSVVGLVLASAANVLMTRGVFTLRDYLPLVLGVVFVLVGLTVWINPNTRKIRLPGASLWPRCVMAVVSGAALAAPALMPSTMDSRVAFALVALLYVIAWQLTRFVVRRSDELMQRVIVDTNQLALTFIAPALFFYGAAERLGLVPQGASIWVFNGIVVWFYFIVASFAWIRRGLDNPLVAEE